MDAPDTAAHDAPPPAPAGDRRATGRRDARRRQGHAVLAAALLLAVATLPGCRWLRPSAPPVQPAVPAKAAPQAPSAPAVRTPPPEAAARLLAEGWRCEDGRSLGTRVMPGGKSLELRIDGLRRTLPRVASASGERFEDADWLFWNRGAQALLQRKPAPPAYCNEVRSLSLVEDARARGVTFRGQGRNPGWLLEIGPGNRLLLAPAGPADAALADRQEWADLPAVPGPAYGSTRHVGEASGRRHVILVQPDPCVDELTGERTPATVLVQVDGRRMRGCGTPIAP